MAIRKYPILKRFLKILRNIALSIIGLIILIAVLINLKPVQTFLARKATDILSKKLNTTVKIDRLGIDFLNQVVVKGLYVEDQSHDTLLYAQEARVRISDWFFFRSETPVLRYIGLKNTYANMYRTMESDKWNYDFIVDAFATNDSKPKKKKKKKAEIEIDLERVELENIRFRMDDGWVGSDMEFDVGRLLIDANEVDFKKKNLDIEKIIIKNTAMRMRDYAGGRPRKLKVWKKATIDNTPFNPQNWAIKLKRLSLDNCYYTNDASINDPIEGEFDPEHIGVQNVNIDAVNLRITGDTLTAKLNNLSAKDRCGIRIKKLKADVTVSPNHTICDNLYLETNNSKLQRYYAMHYTRFPDFKDYIDKVVMVGDLKNSSIDSRDVAYFAPKLKDLPMILKANGRVAGTVDSLVARNLQLNDGRSTLKGDLTMIGLPDINTTWIDFKNGEIFTTGAAVIGYAPKLKNDSSINIAGISHAFFKGGFTGYIENFAANGMLVTNLGTITSNVKMKIPGMAQDKAVYAGTVTTDNFNIGALLRQKRLGTVTMKAEVSGNAFDPKIGKIDVKAAIAHFDYNDYAYQDIRADGVLERNTFTGDVLINDPNLALAFYGNLDFSKEDLSINAKANLLNSNLTALRLTKDSVTATADLDLNLTGKDVDNFSGYAKIYNINMVRNANRLDLDSIYINASEQDSGRLLTIESNALTATVKGDFKLTDIHNSVQYYISGYLPNYISPPIKRAAVQNFTFEIKTKEIEHLLGIIVPDIRGFNNSTFTGALNTVQQQLSLDAQVPYGAFGNVRIYNATVTGDGNERLLGLNADAQNVVLGDSVLKGSVSVTTSVGNDSMLFNIATNSRLSIGTATINGRAFAHGDTLSFNLQQSEFYLKNTRWEIPMGAMASVSDNYLSVDNFTLTSGPQRIEINTEQEGTVNTITVKTEHLDVGMLAALGGMESMEVDGELNGTVQVNDVFKDLVVTADIKGTNVSVGTDTLGEITVAGNYNAAKKRLTLDPKTGIYQGDAYITASGSTTLDSNSNQQIDGKVEFSNTPLAWISPLTVGLVSQLKGALNGSVKIGGTAAHPDVDGRVQLDNAEVKVDFLGTRYNIHTAGIKVDNNEIDFGNITLYDAYKNRAILAGKLTHNRFKDIKLAINMGSSKFEVINLRENEGLTFYGNLIAGFQNLSVTGPIDDIRIRITRAMPAAESHLYLPIGGTSTDATYSYVTFKNYDTAQVAAVKAKKKNKLSITIDARLNDLAEITLMLDPATGDAINAKGTGNINMEIPSDGDIRMYGVYDIERGDYTFTLKQLFFKRRFVLNGGSRIYFNGLIGQTDLNVEGVYTARARLYDLFTQAEKTQIDAFNKSDRDAIDAKVPQNVNVVLNMRGSLENPQLNFKLDLQNKASGGSLAYAKLQTINNNEALLFNEVASLLLIGTLVPTDGGAAGLDNGGAAAGAISNVSEMFSGTASSQLTNMVSKLTGNKDLTLDLRYRQYAYSASATGANDNFQARNTFSFGLTQNLFKNRLTIEYGGSYDWGRPTTASNVRSSYFNPVGDFRVQYQFREGGNLRGYVFSSSSFDAISDQNLYRQGLGISWRKSFDKLPELFRGAKYAREQMAKQLPLYPTDSVRSGTW